MLDPSAVGEVEGQLTTSSDLRLESCDEKVDAVWERGETTLVLLDELGDLLGKLAGVRRTTSSGLAQWRYHGRLVARQLDDMHIVIRSDFEYRDVVIRQFPETFSAPGRFAKHMMVVADLAGSGIAIEDALLAAWHLQRAAD